MKTWIRLRQAAEVPLVRAGLLVIPRLPRGCILRLAYLLGAVGFLAARRERAVGQANLDVVYGDTLSGADKRALLKQTFRVFALTVLDIFWFSRHTVERVRAWVRVDPSFAGILTPGAQVCVTGHIGNWEILGHLTAAHGFPLLSVATPLSNRALEPLMRRLRGAAGQEVVERTGALRALLRHLKEGGKTGIVMDQNIRPREGGFFMEFLGLPARVSGTAASLALKTGAEVHSGFCIPRPDGSYLAFAEGRPIPAERHAGDDEEAVQRLTRTITDWIESAIRRHPHAWPWMYKRWKYIPPGDDPSRYPFYAKPVGGGGR